MMRDSEPPPIRRAALDYHRPSGHEDCPPEHAWAVRAVGLLPFLVVFATLYRRLARPNPAATSAPTHYRRVLRPHRLADSANRALRLRRERVSHRRLRGDARGGASLTVRPRAGAGAGAMASTGTQRRHTTRAQQRTIQAGLGLVDVHNIHSRGLRSAFRRLTARGLGRLCPTCCCLSRFRSTGRWS